MTGRFSKFLIIAIAFIDALLINILPTGVAHDAALRVALLFLCMIPALAVGCLLKSLCCCKKTQ